MKGLCPPTTVVMDPSAVCARNFSTFAIGLAHNSLSTVLSRVFFLAGEFELVLHYISIRFVKGVAFPTANHWGGNLRALYT